jgi:hypothetical protein
VKAIARRLLVIAMVSAVSFACTARSQDPGSQDPRSQDQGAPASASGAAEAPKLGSPAPPRPAVDFFWEVRGLPAKCAPEVVREALGNPFRVDVKKGIAGESTATWRYVIEAVSDASLDSAVGTPGMGSAEPPADRLAGVELVERMGQPLHYERATVYVPGTKTLDEAGLSKAADEWRRVGTLKALVAALRKMPMGVPITEIIRILGKPQEAYLPDATGADPDRFLVYYREKDVSVTLRLVGSSGLAEGRKFDGTILKVQPPVE